MHLDVRSPALDLVQIVMESNIAVLSDEDLWTKTKMAARRRTVEILFQPSTIRSPDPCIRFLKDIEHLHDAVLLNQVFAYVKRIRDCR